MIGIFDSGYGGLTVMRALKQVLPDYDYVYLGDNARAPYGSKSEPVIYAHTCEALDFLFENGAELVILACNTASAKALRRIQQEFLPKHYPDKKVLGVLIPAAEQVAEYLGKLGKSKARIGIIGTRSTISSGTYEDEIKKALDRLACSVRVQIIARPTPLLVPLVEEGWINKPETKMILRKYLAPLKSANIEVLILGCTHYPLLLPLIKGKVSRYCRIIDAPAGVAVKLAEYLQRHPEINSRLGRESRLYLYTTDDPGLFREKGCKFWEKDLVEVKKAQLKSKNEKNHIKR